MDGQILSSCVLLRCGGYFGGARGKRSENRLLIGIFGFAEILIIEYNMQIKKSVKTHYWNAKQFIDSADGLEGI